MSLIAFSMESIAFIMLQNYYKSFQLVVLGPFRPP